MWGISTLLLAQLANTITAPPVVSFQTGEIYVDRARDISVRLTESSENLIVISSHLPAGWTFSVDIDGDENGVWGNGPDGSGTRGDSSLDRSFGQDSRNGVFCSQYILSSVEQDPDKIYAKSECGGLKSKGRAILSGFDAGMRATLSLEIPAEEFFGSSDTAHIQACVWDSVQWHCQHERVALLELKRARRTPRLK